MKSTIRYKKVKGKRVALCDYDGTCRNKAYKEVYPGIMKNNDEGWNYLCKKHFLHEQRRYKNKLTYAKAEW